MLHLLIFGRPITGTGSPQRWRHLMHTDGALRHPVATPRYRTRQPRHAGDEEVFACVQALWHSEAEESPVPLTRFPLLQAAQGEMCDDAF